MDREIRQIFIPLGRNIPGILYEPEKASEKSRVAILVMHSDANYLTFPMGRLMAERGYRVLCANVEDRFNSLDKKLLNLKEAVLTLRKIWDVSKLILMGHSGGGTLMSAYQHIAENGIKFFRGPEKLSLCSAELSDVPGADGVMLLDSNFGIAAMSLFSLDPAVIDEDDGQRLDEDLNLFNPVNGFSPEGSSYPDEFIKKFQQAQGERNTRLINKAFERLRVIEGGKGRYADDEPFIIPGAEQGFLNNKLYAQDIRLMSHTRKEWPLLKADGDIVTEIVRSLRKPENPRSLTGLYHEGALITTVRNYLNSYAVRIGDDYGYNEDSVYGIDWSSAYSCVPGNIRGVTVPLLIMGMTGNWEYLASETIYENAGSKDKTLVFVEGASHLFTPAVQCERFPGEFGDTQKRVFDYVDEWLSHTFGGF
jgi:pimeloyl-ACP methyl ester carboxylesterase